MRIEHKPVQSFSDMLYSCIVLIADQVLPDISEYDSLLLVCMKIWQEVEKQMSNDVWTPIPCPVSDLTLYHPNPDFFMGLALTELGGFPWISLLYRWCSYRVELDPKKLQPWWLLLTPAVLLRHWRVCYRHTCSLFPVWFHLRWTRIGVWFQ